MRGPSQFKVFLERRRRECWLGWENLAGVVRPHK